MKFKDLVPQKMKNIFHFFQAAVAVVFYGFPARKLKVIGITGTDGKTTTVNLIYHILKSAGVKVSMVSTVKAYIGEAAFDTGFHVTTPSPFEVQKFLKMMVKAGSEVAILEVTSHGLDQNRVAFVNFDEGVITNITNDHLDYHGTYDAYVSAKAKLLSGVQTRILNIDDRPFQKLAETGSGKMVSYGKDSKADFSAFGEKSGNGLNFSIKMKDFGKGGSVLKISSPLTGEFNIYNILASVVVAKSLDIENTKIQKALKTFNGIEGRLEKIEEGQNFQVVVDFAHTPNAFQNVLTTLKKETKGKLIVVFGSAGERDKFKRPAMGKIAGKLCDYLVITSEDPRNESVGKISGEISKGVEAAGGVLNKNYWIIPDRKVAIQWTVKELAQSGDTVVLLGKGHEKSMNIGGKEYNWSDQLVVREALTERVKK